MKIPNETTQRLAEAAADAAWAEKLRAAATWAEYEKLLNNKGIEAPAGLQEAFAANIAAKAEKLTDNELEKVAGGLMPGYCGRWFYLY